MLNSYSSRYEETLAVHLSSAMNDKVDSLVNNTELEHRHSDYLRGYIAALKWVKNNAMQEVATKLNEE